MNNEVTKVQIKICVPCKEYIDIDENDMEQY